MIVKKLADLVDTDRDVEWGSGRSRRFLVERDGMGFAVCDTFVRAGTESLLEYKNHLEACYCIEGHGQVEDMLGNRFELEPGVLYALNAHDKHYLRATTDMRLVSIFNPPIIGHERHRLGGDSSSTY